MCPERTSYCKVIYQIPHKLSILSQQQPQFSMSVIPRVRFKPQISRPSKNPVTALECLLLTVCCCCARQQKSKLAKNFLMFIFLCVSPPPRSSLLRSETMTTTTKHLFWQPSLGPLGTFSSHCHSFSLPPSTIHEMLNVPLVKTWQSPNGNFHSETLSPRRQRSTTDYHHEQEENSQINATEALQPHAGVAFSSSE